MRYFLISRSMRDNFNQSELLATHPIPYTQRIILQSLMISTKKNNIKG